MKRADIEQIVISAICVLLFVIVGCTSPKPMDVVNPQWAFDANLFSINPQWQFLLTNNTPPDATSLCPVHTDDPVKWRAASQCTDQDVYVNEATGWNRFECWANDRSAIEAHMNWFPVNYEGSVYWDNHTSPGGDDDYNFSMCRNDRALYTAGYNHIHTEFDSDETVDQWDGTNTWWDRFHNAVDDSDEDARKLLNGNYAQVIGLVGLDGGHSDFHSELHPVYGMLIHLSDDPSDDQWSFFIRNWGDEGYCSNSQEYLQSATMYVEVPHDNADDVVLTSYNIWGINFDNDSHIKIKYDKSPKGVLLAFNFDKPEQKESYVGDIHLHWTGKNLTPRNDFGKNPLDNPTASSAALYEDVNERLAQQVNNLTTQSKFRLNQQLRQLHDRKLQKSQVTLERSAGALFDRDSFNQRVAAFRRQKQLPTYRDLLRSANDASIQDQKAKELSLVRQFVANKHKNEK